ncbi:S-adenosylmethionine carrier 1, chloroplastic/mitochondrial-like isoform X2 [Silene latifolia]|uniref:S-adenosylmethionine carrier 1, chloroplastic/mitochondrial-like isoform X2 n=1 Tax=Silene latifolia TaxID=37657 RepID=UPI003D784B3D
MSPLYSNYLLQVFQNTHLTTGIAANHHQGQADDLVKHGMPQFEESNIQGEVHSKSSSTLMNRPRPLLAEHEYAVSGALSGIVVSLCLHPVDTIKTVLQSCQAGQKSLCYIGQSIITERGLSGLYRGISSNITTSAPISAIYTFTYESVKGFLLPSLAKEHCSIAHCTAGACASIATSFIFTPSDHIKQQMQD